MVKYHFAVVSNKKTQHSGFERLDESCESQSVNGISQIAECKATMSTSKPCKIKKPHLIMFYTSELSNLKIFRKRHKIDYHRCVTHCKKVHKKICPFAKALDSTTLEMIYWESETPKGKLSRCIHNFRIPNIEGQEHIPKTWDILGSVLVLAENDDLTATSTWSPLLWPEYFWFCYLGWVLILFDDPTHKNRPGLWKAFSEKVTNNRQDFLKAVVSYAKSWKSGLWHDSLKNSANETSGAEGLRQLLYDFADQIVESGSGLNDMEMLNSELSKFIHRVSLIDNFRDITNDMLNKVLNICRETGKLIEFSITEPSTLSEPKWLGEAYAEYARDPIKNSMSRKIWKMRFVYWATASQFERSRDVYKNLKPFLDDLYWRRPKKIYTKGSKSWFQMRCKYWGLTSEKITRLAEVLPIIWKAFFG